MLNRLIILLSLISFSFSIDLFFSEYAEGSSNNKYLEIYNPTDGPIELEGYAYPSVSNAPDNPGTHEYWNTFDEGATVAPGDVYVICHGSSDDFIQAECDEFHTYLSNGDDGYCLALGTEDEYQCIDWVGDFNGDPGSAWDVCGLGNTQDHTLVRKSSVISGNDWTTSSNADTCEWDVYGQNEWSFLGFHDYDGSTTNEVIVEAGMFYYAPTVLTIDMGTTVTWDNVSGFHDVVAYDGSFELPACSSPCIIGSITFDEPGVYEYFCSVGSHEQQGMIGTIVVEGDIQLPCEDETACNFGAYEDCTYPGEGECDCEGNVLDCAGECGGDAVVDDCGECGGDGSCAIGGCVFVDMALAEVGEDGMKARTSTINGEYSPSDWIPMDQAGTVYSICLPMIPGNTYGYNFNNNIGSGYESGADLEGVCAGGNYGNDRIFEVPADATGDLYADTVCWESCDACPDVIEGCTDETALNYDENATDDDGSCIYDWPEAANLFFSEYAEGSSNNKYLEIYNATDGDVDLSGYSLSSCSNGCDAPNEWDYPDNVTFDATVASGDVYVVCHQSSDETILAECDQTFTYLSNGDDVFALTQIGSGLVLDVIGVVGEDPGSGWDVDGVSNATKDHTLVRKSWVQSGNPLWLDNVDEDGVVVECGSAGGTFEECESEWIVLDQNDWTFLGSHDMDTGGGDDCGIAGDINGDTIVNILDIVALVNAIVGAYEVDCGDLNGDDTINILDIVAIVNIITSARTTDATSAMLSNNNSVVSLIADGYIGGVQMTLTHGNDFPIALTDVCMASNYVNHGNHTTLVVVEPHSELLFSSNGTFEIKDLIVANSENEINVTMLNDFSLSAAYPNPFNPSTSFDVSIPASGYLSVKVYDLSGKLVDVIANGVYNQSNYTFTWDGSGMPSGMYVINAEYNNTSISHNISLIK